MEKHDSLKEKTNSLEQHEDIVLKTAMREFSKVLLPWLGITEKVVGYGPTENIYLEAKKDVLGFYSNYGERNLEAF